MKKLFTKFWKVMKICASHAMVAMIICGVTVAHDNRAQLLDEKISISIEEASLEKALKEIQAKARIQFFYSIDQLSVRETVSLQAKDQTLRVILDDLLAPYNIGYKVDGKKRAIMLKRRTEPGENNTGLNPSANTPSDGAFAISGTVLESSTQQPMAGVNIIVKGTTVGTTTDAEGRYSIEAAENDMLIFSFIGYVTFEALVDGRNVLDVFLQVDTKNLGEIVINAGYWKVTDRERTGNISRVTVDDIKDQPVNNPLMAIQARMPGVVITQTSGVPGSGMKLQIRGQNSLRTYDPSTGVDGNYPLYVIDGVPVASNPVLSYGQLLSPSAGGIDPLSTLNPSNIESIEILKDADATAIYGSRGANGVVLVTTKKGRSGTTDLDVQVYRGVGGVSKMMNVMNTEQYLAMRNEAFLNDGVNPGPADYDLNGAWDQNRNMNWQKELIGGSAGISDLQASISGGGLNTFFRLGGGFHQEGTVFPGDFGYKKATGFLSLNHISPDQKLKLGLSINYGHDNNDLFDKNIASYALTLPPNAPLFKENGELDWTGYTSLDNANPMSYFQTSHNSKTGNLISSATIDYEVVKGLRVLANLGFSDTQTDQVINTPQSAMNPANPGLSRTIVMRNSMTSWILEPQLAYSNKIGDGKLNILLGTTWQSNAATSLIMDGQGFVSDGLLGNIRAASTLMIVDDADSEYRYNALFGRVGYVWKDRYLLNVTARRDGSSRFGPDRQFGNFGAIGAGWIFSEERFITNALPFVSYGKIRGSYGTTGNDQIGNYGYLSTYSAASTTYQGSPALNTTALSNPDFAWEVNEKLEAAVELGFLKNRIRISTSWYNNRSSNQLVGYPLPATTGFTAVQYNLDATVENSGWEFELNAVNVERTNFRWTTAFNISFPRTELVSYPNLSGSSYANRYVVGAPLSISKRYAYTGIDPQTGLYQVTDVDGSGSYTDVDKQTIVDFSRNFYGGMQNTLHYRSFDLSFSVEFVNQMASDYMTLFSTQPGRRSNQLAVILDRKRWQQDGDDAQLQKFTQVSSQNYARAAASDRSLTESSFLRVKTFILSYALPASALEKIHMKETRVYLQVQNSFTLTNYFGFNPESPYLELPPLRVFGGGVQFKF